MIRKIGKMSIIPIRDWTKKRPSKQTSVAVDDALQVIVGEDAEPDLVEDLAVGRRRSLACRGVVALVRVREPAERAQVVPGVHRRVVDAVADQVGLAGQHVRHDGAEEAEHERDQQERPHRPQVEAVEAQPVQQPRPARRRVWLRVTCRARGLALLGRRDRHRARRRRRLPPPRLVPVRSGSLEVTSQAMASGSGMGTATMSSTTRRDPSRRRRSMSSASSLLTRTKSASFGRRGLAMGGTYRLRVSGKCRARGWTRVPRIWSQGMTVLRSRFDTRRPPSVTWTWLRRRYRSSAPPNSRPAGG